MHRFQLSWFNVTQLMAPLRIHKHAPHHRLTPQQHQVAHRIPVGEGEFNRPTLLAENQLFPNHIACFRDATGVAHAALLQHRSLMAHHHTAIVLERTSVANHQNQLHKN